MKAILILVSGLTYAGSLKIEPITKTVKTIIIKTVLVKPLYSYEWICMVDGIEFFEGYKKDSYICEGGVKTIGFGHTGKHVKKSSLSKKEAREILMEDLYYSREKVLSIVKVPLSEGQLACLTSFTFNCGEGSLRALVNKEGRLNDGNYKSIKEILPLYRRANGKILKGLVKRRSFELTLWEEKASLIASNN